MRATEGLGLFIIVLWVAGFIGWVMNLVSLVHSLHDPITGMFIARCVGVFAAPLGAILGYM